MNLTFLLGFVVARIRSNFELSCEEGVNFKESILREVTEKDGRCGR